jgi:XTP/dITP diphosphohydrolase
MSFEMTLIFATNNQYKVDEIRSVLNGSFSIVSLVEAGIDIDIPEPHDTLQENAKEKAVTIYDLVKNKNNYAGCFSEDTGLEVYALNYEPGVHSARYAGEEKSFEKNIDKLLKVLGNSLDRKARFRTVICLLLEGKEYFFEGICEGGIICEPRGSNGFGYDPVFVPAGSGKTFAEMDMQEKNQFSHRKKAVDGLVAFLNKIQ